MACWPRRSREVFSLLVFLLLLGGSLQAQYRYRTFSQEDLSLRKSRAGKVLASELVFVFRNTSSTAFDGVHAKLNANVISVVDSGGFPKFELKRRGKDIDAGGRIIAPGDSVSIRVITSKKSPGTRINYWWWTSGGSKASSISFDLTADADQQIVTQPNGGYVRDYLYKKVISRPGGVTIGIPDTDAVGWIRFLKSDRKYFSHAGTPRCFDYIANGSRGEKLFVGEKKNIHVKKHDNHLLGEVHALRLAVIANDAGVAEPVDSLATMLGDLIYNDASDPGGMCNGKTVREILLLADSMLTSCGVRTEDEYTALDACVGRINAAFGGDYMAISINPLVVQGTRDLADVNILHPNPSANPNSRRIQTDRSSLQTPSSAELLQNYPNPFNPVTTIEFTIEEPSIVTLTVYNMLGQEVARLLVDEAVEEGTESAEFDGSRLPSGLYYYRLVTREIEDRGISSSQTESMILLK